MDNKDFVRSYKDSELIKRLVGFLKPYKWQFITGLLVTILLVLLDLVPSYLIGVLINILDSQNDINQKILYVSILIGGYFVLIVFVSIITYFNTMLLQKVGQKILYDIRHQVFNHIENLSIAQINKQPIGRLVTRVTSDTISLNDFFTNVLVNLIRSFLTIIFVIVIMFVINVKLTLILLAILPVLAITSYYFRKCARKASRSVRKDVSNINAFLSENLSGMKVTQVFNQEEKKYLEFKERNESLKKSSLKEILIFGIFQPTIYILNICCQLLVIYFGILEIRNLRLTRDKFVTFYMYIGNFFNPIQQITQLFNQIQQAFSSTERILTVLDTKKEVLNKENPIVLEKLEGKIVFDHVWFAYNDEDWILRDVSFTINPKETVAFVGATGAGKTTILGLIVRNYDINKGHIYLDDIDIFDIEIESLRRLVGQMLQDVFMFSGSIYSNITLRDERFNLNDVVEAATYVNANKFIEKFPDKYDHKVFERGNNFSAGQKQLISFARTILHKPNIMILDEATSNIDTETEVLIQDSLEKMKTVGTMLIVAHRLSTVQHADKIIVLRKGEIVEQGNHQELLKNKGLYYGLYKIQFEKMEKTNE